MKKSAIFVIALVMIFVFLSSCAASIPSKESVAAMISEEATKHLKEKTIEEIHHKWGEPDSMLSGFYGDIYIYNDKIIVIYYDNHSRVSEAVVSEKQN